MVAPSNARETKQHSSRRSSNQSGLPPVLSAGTAVRRKDPSARAPRPHPATAPGRSNCHTRRARLRHTCTVLLRAFARRRAPRHHTSTTPLYTSQKTPSHHNLKSLRSLHPGDASHPGTTDGVTRCSVRHHNATTDKKMKTKNVRFSAHIISPDARSSIAPRDPDAACSLPTPPNFHRVGEFR